MSAQTCDYDCAADRTTRGVGGVGLEHEVTGSPELSVIVPSVNGWDDLSECLDSLDRHSGDVYIEVIVVDRCGLDVCRQVSLRFPRVRLLPMPRGTSIPDLRARGIAAASADAVAVIEDHVQVTREWARRILAAHRKGEEVVGGSVINAATQRVVDWAAFLCEYSHLLPPLPAGPSETLTGNNTVYRRELLDRYRTHVNSGRWEDHLHRALRRDGVTLFCHPEIIVAHKKHYTVRGYLAQRYLFARSYAGGRLSAAAWPTRLAYATAAVALPPLLLSRIVARLAVRPQYRAPLAKSLPLLTVFVIVWAYGEIVGAVAGPGDSLSRVS
jgi:glycosyltransferase involved in cell wall biosynthesis